MISRQCATESCHNEAGALPIFVHAEYPVAQTLGGHVFPPTRELRLELYVCGICENAIRLADVRGLSL